MLRRLTVVLCFGVLFGTVPAYAGLHPLGLKHEDLGKVAPGHQVTSIPVAAGARSFRELPWVDLTGEMPPVGNQGSQGSCAAWSITYYQRTQLEYHERHWDLADPNHQFSPAFTYNQVNGGADRGSGFANNMPLICEQGCASMADFPYDQYNCTRWPSESAYSHAIPFRTRDWAWFRIADTTGIGMVKQLLANGSTSSLSIAVWGNFDNIGQYHNTYCSSDRTGSNRGGHLVTFVGYDDTMTTHDGVGAFKMVNSWGTGWGAHGYFWMSYEAVHDGYLSEGAVGYMTDTVGYVPLLLARVRVRHPTRDRVGLGFTVGPIYGALWLKDFRSWRDAGVDQPFPDNNIVFDLTDAVDFIRSRQTDSVYFWVTDCRRDGLTGSVEYASVQCLDWGTMFAAESVPVQIPDDGVSVVVGMRMQELDRDVTTSWIFGPSGIVEPESSYVPVVEVRNYGHDPATFPVRLTIGQSYSDTVQIEGLAPGTAEDVAFARWTVPARCTVTVRCSTALAGDEYPANDVGTVLAWARYCDVALVEITAPDDTVDSGATVRPQVRVRNNGTQPETFLVTFTIPTDGYQRTVRVTVPADSWLLARFAPWIPRNIGSHAMKCSLDLAGDMDPVNDSIGGIVFVRAGSGLAEARAVPATFGLETPRPSLFSRTVDFGFSLSRAGAVNLAVYDATGARVRLLLKGQAESGLHRLTWDGKDEQRRPVASGAYFCRLEADGRRAGASLLKP